MYDDAVNGKYNKRNDYWFKIGAVVIKLKKSHAVGDAK